MWLRSLFQSGRTRKTQSFSRSFRPSLESLEDRCLPSSVAYFIGSDPVHGTELWKSDGTPQGTGMVKDINPGIANGAVPLAGFQPLPVMNGTIFFPANDGIHGTELWKSDGTAAGTMMVKDINPGSGDSLGTGSRFAVMNNTLFFTANDGVHGIELWKSDGTAAGTVRVKYNVFFPMRMTVMNNVLYFSAQDYYGYTGLWRSDGTAAGTYELNSTFNSANSFSNPDPFTVVNGTLYFAAHGGNLWKSDGTAAGTVMIKSISAPPLFLLTNVGGTLMFVASDMVHGGEWWKSDGTAAGTALVKDINPGSASSVVLPPLTYYHMPLVAVVNGTLFFSANDGVHGTELWKSNGTATGTALVSPATSALYTAWWPTNVNGTLFFVGPDNGLWKSDGTAAGTLPVHTDPASPLNNTTFANVNGTLFFRNGGYPYGPLWLVEE